MHITIFVKCELPEQTKWYSVTVYFMDYLINRGTRKSYFEKDNLVIILYTWTLYVTIVMVWYVRNFYYEMFYCKFDVIIIPNISNIYTSTYTFLVGIIELSQNVFSLVCRLYNIKENILYDDMLKMRFGKRRYLLFLEILWSWKRSSWVAAYVRGKHEVIEIISTILWSKMN